MIGTPEDCVRHFERLWKGSNGGFGGVLLLAHNWADWPATKRSYELMARFVHPHFQRNANGLRDWSYSDAQAKFATPFVRVNCQVSPNTVAPMTPSVRCRPPTKTPRLLAVSQTVSWPMRPPGPSVKGGGGRFGLRQPRVLPVAVSQTREMLSPPP